MTSYVVLLRAVNVAGRQLKMDELKRIASELGLESPRTYIASGNLLFSSGKNEGVLKSALERAIAEHMGASVNVMVRTANEMAAVVAANPFRDAPPNKVIAIFLNEAPAKESIANAKNVSDERMALGQREIYVHYPDGMGTSKLKIRAAAAGTGRNMNTVAKLVELMEAL